jgi:adenylate cyclase
VGNIGYLPDSDGILRRLPVSTQFQGKIYPGFATALRRCAPSSAIDMAPHADAQGLWRIPYRRTMDAYTVIPASAVLLETAPLDLLTGRYVLVGSSALGLGDRVSIPLAPLSAGVMVHAYSLSALLDQTDTSLSRASPAPYIPTLWVLLATMIATICLTFFSTWANLILQPGIAASWLAVAYWGSKNAVEWSFSLPLWVFLLFILTITYQEWRASRRQALKLIDTFSHYVAQPVLDEILRLGLQYSLRPTLSQVTVLIADMEGYTRTTSSLSLEDAAQLTKDFLDCLTRPVLQFGGTLDKYSGDGLVAFWGAPLPCPDQADRAVNAGLAILNEVERFNAGRFRDNAQPVRVRIGIESGPALVGDLGTPFRSTYTAVGDCINFASRLESAARDLPTSLVIGAAANKKLEQHVTFPLGSIALRDTATRLEIFTIERCLETVKPLL